MSQELAHTSKSNVLSDGPWHMDLLVTLREVMVKNSGGLPEVLTKNTETSERLHSLFHTDSKCVQCKARFTECECKEWCAQQSDETFQPTPSFKKRLENAERNLFDRMYNYGRAGSPFCGFTFEDDMGCLSSLLHLSWLCRPLFTGDVEHGKSLSDSGSYWTLLQDLGAASDRNAQWDIVKKLKNKYCNQESAPLLQSPELQSPVKMLKTWLADFTEDYVNKNIGIEVEETRGTASCNKKTVNQAFLSIEGREYGSLETMMSSGECIPSVKGSFFWVQIGTDTSNFFCEPLIETDTHKYHLLGFLSTEKRDGKCHWVATIRDHGGFFVLDHSTCEPKEFDMQWRGVSHAKLLLYGTNTPTPPTWLRTGRLCDENGWQRSTPSGGTGAKSELFDYKALAKDGLVTGSVRDLLTRINMPNLQLQLQQGVAEVVGKMRRESKMYQSADKLGSVNGWPMPHPNDLSLVHENGPAGSVRFTKEFGEVRSQRWATSSICEGLALLVCSFFFVCVFSK